MRIDKIIIYIEVKIGLCKLIFDTDRFYEGKICAYEEILEVIERERVDLLKKYKFNKNRT